MQTFSTPVCLAVRFYWREDTKAPVGRQQIREASKDSLMGLNDGD